ncbi:hypothetical protein L3Q82_024959, partial [Scortum barcoo]
PSTCSITDVICCLFITSVDAPPRAANMTFLMRLCILVVNVLCLPLHLIEALGLYQIYKRIFPMCLYRISANYNKKMRDKKTELFRSLPEFSKPGGKLTILEIGCGTGSNFEFYPPGSKVICTDPNPHFQKYLTKSMETNDHLTYERFLVVSGEDLGSIEDESVDAVVCTLVLCTVNSVAQTLREAHRILRPGGAFFFMEHVVAEPSTWAYFFQHVLQPLCSAETKMQRCLMKSCRLLCLALTLPLRLMELAGLCAPYKRVFPLLAYNITFSYNDKMHRAKRELFRNVGKFAREDGSLRLLEIGCGSGANFGFYPDGCTVVCADPNPHFEKYLRMSMDANAHLTYDGFVVAPGEDMGAVEDESVDVVVCTLVLCSVGDALRVLREVRRVLRPGGAFYFLEHVVSDPSSWTYFFQHVLEPLWYYLGDGCTITRATWKDLEAAGFSELHLKHIEAPEVTPVIRPHIMGYSIK